MKQSVKLPGIETKEPLLNEMRHLIKNTEDIKVPTPLTLGYAAIIVAGLEYTRSQGDWPSCRGG